MGANIAIDVRQECNLSPTIQSTYTRSVEISERKEYWRNKGNAIGFAIFFSQ